MKRSAIAADELIHRQVRVDPREALEWAESFTSKTVRFELVRSVFGHWSNVDPDGAVREVLGLRDREMRDAAANDIASLLLSGSREYPRYVGVGGPVPRRKYPPRQNFVQLCRRGGLKNASRDDRLLPRSARAATRAAPRRPNVLWLGFHELIESPF